ncbi:Multidrug resistance ABC transporter ATP-binding and permease protein [Giardia lamblia P15]|uniref:Multidrug resistance ABC transporter ATP-binding and permease protein n=1 Tax=Giardia intestinalis (strain P15) TaxID=658858 RepID=E1F0D8_GIAIA|nr:Multidrug resistance ABC transporter ATP-binding and permease protein [Giardia lamblia P15]
MLEEGGLCSAVKTPGEPSGKVGCTGGGQYEAKRRASEKDGPCIYGLIAKNQRGPTALTSSRTVMSDATTVLSISNDKSTVQPSFLKVSPLHKRQRRESILTILAILYMDVGKISLYILIKILQNILTFWYMSTLSITINAYAIVSQNTGFYRLTRRHIHWEYFEMFEGGYRARFSWLVYRMIGKVLNQKSLAVHLSNEVIENPFGDTICGMEHALVYMCVQFFILSLWSFCYSILQAYIQRVSNVLKDIINNRIYISFLSVLLTHHLSQPYQQLEQESSGERASTLNEYSQVMANLITSLLEKAIPSISYFLIILVTAFLGEKPYLDSLDNGKASIANTKPKRKDLKKPQLSSIASTIHNRHALALILIALLPVPFNVLMVASMERQRFALSSSRNSAKMQSVALLTEVTSRYRLIKLYDAVFYEIKNVCKLMYKFKNVDIINILLRSTSRKVKALTKRYSSSVLTLGSTIYLSLNILDYRQVQQIRYIVSTITTQITKLLEIPGIVVDTYEHFGVVIKELSKPQEAGLSGNNTIGFVATCAYLQQHWTDITRSSSKVESSFNLRTWAKNCFKRTACYINIGVIKIIPSLFRYKYPASHVTSANFDIAEKMYMQELMAESQQYATSQELSPLIWRIYPCIPTHIEFRDVCFSYKTGCDVLHNLTLSVCPGQKVAIVGRSGVGKSTIINLLTRLYTTPQSQDTSSSGIYLNGRAIGLIPPEELRRLITVVPQDNILIRGSATDNIVYGRPRRLTGSHTEEEQRSYIREVIRLSYEVSRVAVAEELLGDAPYSGTLQGLSGGQRQRIGIARAVARGGSVLVLDEATSALDEETEKRVIHQLFRSLDRNQSVIVISHRLSTLKHVDLIYVLSNPDGSGTRVVESGSYDWFVAESQYLKDADRDISGLVFNYNRSSADIAPCSSHTSPDAKEDPQKQSMPGDRDECS